VSLYNETLGEPILPSPVLGIVGAMKTEAPVGIHFRNAGRAIILLGGVGSADAVRMGGTQFAKAVLGSHWGLPPVLDMDYEKRVHAAIREVVTDGLAESAHDCADGGVAVALAECCFNKAGIGASVQFDSELPAEMLLFHEGPSRILVSTADAGKVLAVAVKHGVEALQIGETAAAELVIANQGSELLRANIPALKHDWENALENLLHG
jgi:phosphoribosylformylglycinamidine synthase subunit PurL